MKIPDCPHPEVEEFRTAAKVCRWTYSWLHNTTPWWLRWMYPIAELRSYAANFELMADKFEEEKP